MARHDQPLQPLQGLAAIAQLDPQPVEQIGMRRLRSHAAEIVGSIDDSAAEMILPQAVGNAAPREWIAFVGNPAGERGPTFAFALSREQTCSSRSGSYVLWRRTGTRFGSG